MNLLFGLRQGNGAPVDPALLFTMGASFPSMDQAAAHWHSDSVGLGCLPGLHTPAADAAPAHDDVRGLHGIASGRLINRGELGHALGIPTATAHELSDSALILAAWARWQADCVHHLDGDWHFALWDAPAQRLFLARRSSRQQQLLLSPQPRVFRLCLAPQKPLLALTQIPQRLHRERMAQILSGSLGDGSESGYADIQRLPAAHTLTLDADGLRVQQYWFPETLSPLHIDDHEAVAEFLRLYRRAVDARIPVDGKTGAMLSGGLDSGSLAVLAAEILGERGRSLSAFASVPITATAPDLAGKGAVDEGPLAAAVAEMSGNIQLTRITAEGHSPLAAIAHMLWVHDEPSYPASNSYWLSSLYTEAKAQGITVLLNGTVGNDTVSWRGIPPNLWQALLQAGPGAMGQRWQQIRAQSGLSPTATFWSVLLKPILRAHAPPCALS